MSMPHCVSSAARDIEHGREGGHFALQERPHNLVAPNAVAHIATSQKGMACSPRDPKCGRFFVVYLILAKFAPQPFLASRGQPREGRGGEGGSNPPSRGKEHPRCALCAHLHACFAFAKQLHTI